MKNLIKNLSFLFVLLIGGSAFAQSSMKKEGMSGKEAKVVKLTQTPGEFNKKKLKLKAGEPYIFEVMNKGVDHEVGFVVAPKGKTEQKDHIKNAYVQEMIADGKSSTSKEVVLEKGEYVFFCPMNPTPHYSIVVQ